MRVCVCVLLRFEGLLGAVLGLSSTLGFDGSPHQAHTTALPVLISSHAGELWHRAGRLLEKRETYSKKKIKKTTFLYTLQRDTQ